jgi:hypothetical protein
LQHLQISIDNVEPDGVSKKSLKVLDSKLRNLSRHAEFFVNINSVVGGGIQNPEDAVTITERAVELGFTTTLGIIHDGHGRLRPLGEREMRVYDLLKDKGKWGYARFSGFRDNLAGGRPNDWRCRAGARYLYVCEDGRVHYCSQQRGYPNIPLEKYDLQDVEREYLTPKSCAPYCTLACANLVGLFDNWRAPQTAKPQVVGRTDPQEA